FSERLVEQVAALGDPRLFVLASHSAGERSHLSPALRRSVFGYFVSTGLQGAADANRDQAIDFGELSRFVSTGVSGWVRQTTGRQARQTPVIAWGGGATRGGGPVLSAVPKERAAKGVQIDHVAAVEKAREPNAAEGQVANRAEIELNNFISDSLARSLPRNRAGQYISTTARNALNSALGSNPAGQAIAKAAGTAESPDDEKAPAAKPKTDAPTDKVEQAVGEKPATDQPATDQPATDQPATEGEGAPAKPAPVSPAKLAAKLHAAWQLRDELAARDRPVSRPIDDAPHLWRELEARLMALDRQQRTGFVPDSAQFGAALDDTIASLTQIAAGTPADQLPAGSLAQAIALARPGYWLAAAPIRSLAMAEMIAAAGGPPVQAEWSALAARLDQLIASGNRADLENLAKDLKPAHDRLVELRAVRRMAGRPEIDWRIVHLVLANAREGEQAACALSEARDTQALAAADKLRIAAEREALAPVAAQEEALFAQLKQAREQYAAIRAAAGAIMLQRRLRNEVIHKLPQFLVLRALGEEDSEFRPTHAALLQLIGKLDGDAAELEAALRAVEQTWMTPAVLKLAGSPAAPGAAWRIAVLLETALAPASARQALAAAWPALDGELAALVQPVEDQTVAPSQSAAERLFVPRAELQHALGNALLAPPPDADWEPLDFAWQQLQTSNSQSLSALQGAFAVALADLYRNLPARVERGLADASDLSAPATRRDRMRQLAAWQDARRLIPSCVAAGDAPAQSQLAAARAYDWLVWQRERALAAAADAAPLEAGYLAEIADDFLSAASNVPRQPPLVAGPPMPLQIDGGTTAALSLADAHTLDLTLRFSGAAGTPSWVLLDFDPEIVSVEPTAGTLVYPWSEVAGGLAGHEALVAQLKMRRPSHELSAGRSIPLRLHIKRLAPAPRPTHLVVRVATERYVARHDVEITLPLPEAVRLFVTGTPASWTPVPGGVTLHPFANRGTDYGLQLASGTGDERTVDVQLLPLLAALPAPFPPATLSADDAKALRASLELGPLLADAKGLLLPADGRPQKLVLIAPEPPPPPMPEPQPGAAPPIVVVPAAAKPKPTPLDHGLVLVITDTKDQRQIFKHLAATPQRPQRFVRPRVNYSGERERIEISVAPIEPALLPPGGVKVSGEIVETLPPDAERQLDGTLTASQPAELYVEVPAAAGRVVNLRLAVDGYPRAFLYRVTCSGDAVDLPEDSDTVTTRITNLPKGTIYKPPVASIPVELQIDAPAAASGNPPLRAEVGIDRNRDRELNGDEVVVLTTDRQVSAALTGITPQGVVQVEAQVRDWKVDVPADAVGNGRANVMARAAVGDVVAFSPPVEIVIDSRPPRVSGIEIKSGRIVVIGTDVELSALADDQQLSGIGRVEGIFDKERSGKFPAEVPAIPGAIQDDGRWHLKLPTAGLASGTYNILVRAVDRADNTGEVARASVQVLTEAEAAAASQARNTGDITGVVRYGPEPQGGLAVFLLPDAGMPVGGAQPKGKIEVDPKAVLARTVTKSDGSFVFPKIAPGKYVVVSEGLIKNKNRQASAAVSFQKPQELQPVEIILR
ncbi:MAG: hypothetical protein SFU86_03710, partial [Pirellulaceae bacterium]|nr:hypothetical protein [Pirellulaceae bacterium]